MALLDIKPSHKPIRQYYEALNDFEKHGAQKETSVRAAFQEILTTYARKLKWSFIAEYGITLTNGNAGSVDGAIVDSWSQPVGYWEAKDSADDLRKEIDKKFYAGYPKSNILFQAPKLAILIQDGSPADEYDLTQPERLAACVTDLLCYRADEQADWEQVVNQFKERIPESARKVVEMIEEEKKSNARFKTAFQSFAELCRASINPNLADAAVEEMLVQHLLTSRIFATVFDNPEFVRRNVIASEIEKVIDALTSRSFNRQQFFAPLDHFYRALENRAKSITDWSQKQAFLNTVYEKFFQGFAVKVADTHGIVYTPQPIVDFMVRSVEHILKTEFGRSLASEGVHILDPFTGTGNFVMRIIREIAATQKSKLPYKFANELHCNEVMLLPYYIASMNIEHEYYTHTKEYKPFEGICLVDTFELAEPAQTTLFSTENSERVERQKKSPIFVIIGNPPYNMGQADENDNNKNRKYPVIDKRVGETYAKSSIASLKNKLSDPYVKAFRWATDRIGEEGIVCLVTNSGFIQGKAFDGMRKHLSSEFATMYVLDLGGDVRSDVSLSGTKHNIFGIQVGVSINVFVRSKNNKGNIFYSRFDQHSTRKDKLSFLNQNSCVSDVKWNKLIPDERGKWLHGIDDDEFADLMPVGDRATKGDQTTNAIFRNYSLGVATNRDDWLFDFDYGRLSQKVSKLIQNYNSEVARLSTRTTAARVDQLVNNDPSFVKWTDRLHDSLRRGKLLTFEAEKLRPSLYRPFSHEWLYFDALLNQRQYQQHRFFPSAGSESENIEICVTSHSQVPFSVFISDRLPCIDIGGRPSQCFPFYTYDEDGGNRKENITDWALTEFRAKVNSKREGEITKWDIFYYVYGLLHHPEYRTKYAANLRRELPRIPISPGFWEISEAGKKLAGLHVNYEQAPEYPLGEKWSDDGGLNFRVEKMKLTKKPPPNPRLEKAGEIDLIYNKDLTLTGIPPKAFEYRLGNRSAIDWIIDQYQVSTDKRSGITNDPNREDDPSYIVNLLKKVVTVSLETVRIVGEIALLSLT